MAMKRTRTAAAAAVLACGALLAGCGGGGEDSSESMAQAAPAAAGDGTGTTAQAPAAEAGTASADAGAAAVDLYESSEALSGAGNAAAPKAGAAKASKAAAPRKAAAGAAADKAMTEGAGKTAFKTATGPLANRDLIYTADMSVQVTDVGKAVSQVESAALAAGGVVVNSARTSEPGGERTGKDGTVTALPDRQSATMTLRVPPGDFDDVLARIAKTGDVLDRTLTGKDVTAEVVDVRSRIASQRKSVERIRDLMDKATSLRDIVSLESEVSQREAELEALLAKQAKLADQTALATITVRLSTKPDGKAAVTTDEDTREAGFVSGLHSGWEAFVAAMVVAATVLGAVLPFAVVLLVLGPPVTWFVLRVRRAAADSNPAT
jgi:hypothetical protein